MVKLHAMKLIVGALLVFGVCFVSVATTPNIELSDTIRILVSSFVANAWVAHTLISQGMIRKKKKKNET
jgi:hypothetical protein